MTRWRTLAQQPNKKDIVAQTADTHSLLIAFGRPVLLYNKQTGGNNKNRCKYLAFAFGRHFLLLSLLVTIGTAHTGNKQATTKQRFCTCFSQGRLNLHCSVIVTRNAHTDNTYY